MTSHMLLASIIVLISGAAAGAWAQEDPRGEAIAVRGPAGPYGETLTIDDKGMTLKFPNEVATLRIGGRLHLDYGAADIRQPGFGEPFSDNI